MNNIPFEALCVDDVVDFLKDHGVLWNGKELNDYPTCESNRFIDISFAKIANRPYINIEVLKDSLPSKHRLAVREDCCYLSDEYVDSNVEPYSGINYTFDWIKYLLNTHKINYATIIKPKIEQKIAHFTTQSQLWADRQNFNIAKKYRELADNWTEAKYAVQDCTNKYQKI